MAKFVRHEACEACGSSDAKGVWDDNSAHCFSCGQHTFPDGKQEELAKFEDKDWSPLRGEYQSLNARSLTADTCKEWQYQVGTYNGKTCHIANYRGEDGRLLYQKVRLKGKEFLTIGNAKDGPLYGQWLNRSGKQVTITEGEIDALSVSQAFDGKWPVVSLPNGSQSVEGAITRAYEWLDKFDRIVLMFDADGPGREAAEKAANILPAGKVAIATFPEDCKDPNDVLVKHGPGDIVKSFWNAKTWRPDGIKQIGELSDEFFNPPPVRGIPYPWDEWNEVAGQMRLGALTTFTAGTGVGKSTAMRELLYHALVTHGEPVGAMFLEEDTLETVESLVSVHLSKNIALDRTLATAEETKEAFDFLASKPLYIYDHFGSSEVDNICAKIRYLVKACGVRWIFLDHISILVSGLEGDERRTIDIAMTKLRTLVSELKCGLFCVVHLRRPQGDKGHEDGAEVHLGQLRGSHSIAQLSDTVIGFRKPEEDPHGNTVEAVCLKNRRNGGRKGPMGTLIYDRHKGRLSNNLL